MVSFAVYSSLQTNKDVSLSDMAMENVEALASLKPNPLCPNGCLDIVDVFCLCNGPHQLREADWGDSDN